jgi:hypothetical protein
MTYQEKAQELVQKHMKYAHEDYEDYEQGIKRVVVQNAIKAALITARECLKADPLNPGGACVDFLEDCHEHAVKYWESVITELEKMKG